LGNNNGSVGTYNLNAGTLYNTNIELFHSTLNVGVNGTGNFNQYSGTVLSDTVKIGVGSGGQGTFTQSGGGHTVSLNLYVGYGAGSVGTYNLNAGTLTNTADNLIGTYFENYPTTVNVGVNGTGYLNQNGGTLSGNTVNIGTNPAGSGTYTMNQGSLTTKDLTVGSSGAGAVTGTLAITNAAAQVSVGGNLTINERGLLNAAPGVTINMTGANFYDYKPNDDLSNLRLFFSNATASDTLGFAGTLRLGTLELTGGTEMEHLTLALENLLTTPSPMTLYVGNLILGDYATLDLNGLNLCFLHETRGTGVSFLDGTPQQVVPLPPSAWLFLSGLVGLGLLGRRKKGKTS